MLSLKHHTMSLEHEDDMILVQLNPGEAYHLKTIRRAHVVQSLRAVLRVGLKHVLPILNDRRPFRITPMQLGLLIIECGPSGALWGLVKLEILGNS